MKKVRNKKIRIIVAVAILSIILVELVCINNSEKISLDETKVAESVGKALTGDSATNVVRTTANEEVYVPKGFYYVGGTLSNGVIISDNSADQYVSGTDKTTYEYSKQLKGNQFVWIPCTEANYKSTTWVDSKDQGNPPSGSASTIELTQIRKYGGFYVGRYEAGLPDAMEYKQTMYPTSQNYNKSGKPLSQANKIPWMYISWPTAKENAISMYSGNQYVQSRMITDIQFDVILNTLKNRAGVGSNAITFNSSEWANYWTAYTHSYNGRVAVYNGHHDASAGFVLDYMHPFSGTQSGTTIDHEYVAQQTGEYPTTAELLSTGASADFMKYHIFDLAGNVWDMTESGTSRGSCMINAYDFYNAAYRTGAVGNTVSPQFGFRVVLYMNQSYNVSFNSNGGTPTPTTQTVLSGAKATRPSNPTKTGYTFKQWNKQGTTTAYDFNTPVTSDITLVAEWTPNTNTPYKVEHYKKNASGGYTKADTDNKTGTTGASVTATPKTTYTGFKENTTHSERVATGTIKPDGSLVLKLYYDPISYKITYVLNGGTNDSRNPATYTVLDTITFQPATRPGYDFKGWFENANFTTPITGIANRTGDITVYAKWEARTDTPYKVEHYKKNANGGYTKADTDNKTGTTDTKATAVPRTYEGFKENTTHADRVPEGIIKGDGSLVLKLYYDPIIYKITYVLNGGKNDSRNPSTYTVLDTITFQPATRPGYDFQGWHEDAKFTTPITGITNRIGDITVYAKWKARDDTPYKVEHYKKKADGTYGLAATDNLKGTTDTEAIAEPKNYAGYEENILHPDRVPKGIINGEGTLVLKLYYDPIRYRIIYVLNGGTNDERNPDTFTMDDIINFQPATKEGSDFLGWYEDPKFTVPKPGISHRAADITIYAKWEDGDNIEYKVEHYKKNKNGTYDLATIDKLTGTTGDDVEAVAKVYEGYEENKKHPDRVPTGKIKGDGSLVLKLYYDPIIYKIDYVLNGGTNDSRNPNTYTVDDVIEFKPATKPGYDFEGWYEDKDFKKPITGIAGRTGNITVYAKWKAKTGIDYKVEHYKEIKEGQYELAVTDALKGEVDKEVTATPKVFEGYKENTQHKNRVATGKIKADGSLVLKLYYDKVKHTVSFDPQDGTPVPDQIVPHNDKAKEPNTPVKDNYKFEYWYYINDKNQEVRYNFNDPVTKDIRLIAKWSKVNTPVNNTPVNNKPVDNTSAPTKIPQTGDFNPVMTFAIIGIISVALITGFKYFKTKIK